MTSAAAVDLGTTNIKAALLTDGGTLGETLSLPAPPLTGIGLIRESDPLAYLAAAEQLLERLTGPERAGIPLGMASQRSSFLFWERDSGSPLSTLVSWQDRRALAWCEARRDQERWITDRTGLPLSPHYAGPKAAVMLQDDRALRRMAAAGEALFGTLDTWLAWNLTTARRHITDRSMAARTLLAGLADHDWSDELLAFFDIPRAMLPTIVPPSGRHDVLRSGAVLTASIADQSAAFSSLRQDKSPSTLVNLGTGGFVLVPAGKGAARKEGYLSGTAAETPEGAIYFREGTVNGIAAALEHLGDPPPFFIKDPSPGLFCIPDMTGIGAPFWHPDRGPVFSKSRGELTGDELTRVVREGIVFRICGIIEDLEEPAQRNDCHISGGLSRDPFLTGGIASCLGRSCRRIREKETTLLGAALMAAGKIAPVTAVDTILPQESYLAGKFNRWKAWVESVL